LPLGLRSLILDHTWPPGATAAYGAWLQAGAAAEGRLLWCERAAQQGQAGGQVMGGAGVGAKRPRWGGSEPRPPPVPLFDVCWLPQHLEELHVALPAGTRVLNAPAPAPALGPGGGPSPSAVAAAQLAGGPPIAKGAGHSSTTLGGGASTAGPSAAAAPSAAAGPSTAARPAAVAGPSQAGGQGQPGWQQPGWWPRLEVVAAPEGGNGGEVWGGPQPTGGGGEGAVWVLKLRPGPPAEDGGSDDFDEEEEW
jgi:hypothetical protein